MDADPRPWETTRSRRPATLHLFQPRWDTRVHPVSGASFERLVLETPDWVNVVARTVDDRFVAVRQFRFGSDRVTTEIPGGVVDPGEDPREAVERELLEETGYRAARWTHLGAVEPNSAFHDNLCHHYLAEGCERVGDQALDPGEDIRVVLLDEEQVRQEVATGRINHTLVLSALCRVVDLRGVHGPTGKPPDKP